MHRKVYVALFSYVIEIRIVVSCLQLKKVTKGYDSELLFDIELIAVF